MSEYAQGRLRATVRALQHRNFQLFFGGQLISLVGTWMQSVAQSWLVYRLIANEMVAGHPSQEMDARLAADAESPK